MTAIHERQELSAKVFPAIAQVVSCAQEMSEWASIYIKYVRVLGKLETVYDQMVHPQKRQDVKQALEACIGRTVAVRHWLVRLLRSLIFPKTLDMRHSG